MAEQKAPWAVREVRKADVPRSGPTVWSELWRDVRLRLERTDDGMALEYTFPDERTAMRAKRSLNRLRRSWRLRFRMHMHGARIYIAPEREQRERRERRRTPRGDEK